LEINKTVIVASSWFSILLYLRYSSLQDPNNLSFYSFICIEWDERKTFVLFSSANLIPTRARLKRQVGQGEKHSARSSKRFVMFQKHCHVTSLRWTMYSYPQQSKCFWNRYKSAWPCRPELAVTRPS
jgi:hypothetical protein